MASLPSDDPVPLSARAWWADHRLRYNLWLIAAAPVSLACAIATSIVFPERLPCVEGSVFQLIGDAVLFSIGLLLANLFYFLGPAGEWLLRLRNPQTYRRWTWTAGLALSLMLVFSPAITHLQWAYTGERVGQQCFAGTGLPDQAGRPWATPPGSRRGWA